MKKKKIILGIDLSISSTGLGLIDGNTGEVIAYDKIPIKPKDFDSDDIKKGNHIAEIILNIIEEYNVTHVAIEDNYIDDKKRGTGKQLARLFGVVKGILVHDEIDVLIYEYTPSQWRKIATGVGKSKEGAFKWLTENVIDIGEYNDRNCKDKNSDMMDGIGLAYALYKRLKK